MGKRHEEGKTIGGILNRNGKWYARIKVKGVQKWKAAPDKDSAEIVLGRMREDAKRERIGIAKVQRDTLAGFAPRYLSWAKANKDSWARDERSLAPLLAALGHLRLSELTKARVEAFARGRLDTESISSARAREAFDKRRAAGTAGKSDKPPARRNLSPASVNRELACLRKLLNLATEIGDLEANPIAGIRLYREAPGRIPSLEPADESRLIAALPAWMHPIVRVAILTGCRESEILALRWRAVDFAAATLTVEDSKSGESRRVPLHPALADELRARRGTLDGWVVLMPSRARTDKRTGKPLDPARDPHSVSQAFRRATRKIGRADLRFHDLRHVAGSRLLAAGASLPEVAAMLGHKTLAMAKRYAHVSPVRLASLVAAMPANGGTPATATAAGEAEHG